MFEALSDRLEGIFTRIRGKGRLSEQDVDEVLREIRLALLEADVNFRVVKNFIGRVREDLVGEELSKALNPFQQVVQAVHRELVNTLGGETLRVTYASKPPTVVLMAGLQGSGKTTTSAKLARWFKSQGRHPLLVGADLQRPAAVEQLRTLANQIEVPVFSEPTDPVEVARAALGEARRLGRDVVIVDTAGRLAIDQEMMEQVRQISEAVQPHYTFLVIDAMTGQDAVNTAEAFHATLALDGVILTKLDGDARGGAALSVKEVVGKPIAFASTGEKLRDFDLFHPDRLAGRILGMGDVLTLIEKAEEVYEKEQAEEAAAKLLEGQFTLEDFLEQMQQVKKMGNLTSLMKLLPGVPKELRNQEIDDRELAKVEAIIYSMTPEERRRPELIDASRRSRIAAGSGMQPQDVSNLLTQFKQMQHIMKQSFGFGSKKMRKARNQERKKKGPGGARPAARGGRVTPKGGGRVTPKKPKLALPGLEDPQLPAGFPDLAGRAGGSGLEGLEGFDGFPGRR
jgi:signal recognition particle subunit SRP54